MCNFSGEERAEVWSATRPTARKEHKCGCCGGRIAPGEKYMAMFAVSDGDAVNEKACAACDEALDAFGKEHRFYPFPTSFETYLEECIVGDEEGSRWAPMLKGIQERRAAA